MANHKLRAPEIQTITPDKLVKLSANELVEIWKDRHGLDLDAELVNATKAVRDNTRISSLEKLEALIKVRELLMRIEKSKSSDKSGVMRLNIIARDPRQA